MAKIVIVGSGIGGLGCAALLAKQGHEVQVFERNDFIGGRCSSSVKDGMGIDNFAHIFPIGNKGPLGMIAREVGEKIEFIHHDPAALVYDALGGKVKIFPEPLDITPLPAQARMARNLGVKPTRAFGAARLFRKLLKASDPFIEANDDKTLESFINEYTDDPNVHRFMNVFCYMMFTISYRRASAGEFIYCFREMSKAADISYPKGSAGVIPAAYQRGLERYGGQVFLRDPVRRIICREGKVAGVATETGEVEADIVVSNAGVDLTLELAGVENLGEEFAAMAKRLQYSGSGAVAKYFLSRQLVDAPAIIYIPDANAGSMFSFIEEGGTPRDLMMMMPVVDRLDPESVRAGHSLIIAATPGVAEPGNEATGKLLEALERQLFRLFPEMENNVIWKQEVRPEHIARATGRRRVGDSVGIAQIPGQVGRNKPSPHTPVEGLYLVGMDAGARGIGTWQAAASAEKVAALIRERHPA